MAQTTKIMLVEDDNNLSEIYQARMTAEGFTVITAHDGEEALALAAKEKPDLIILDVMMPKISGFEMLDILRNTVGLKDTKVIMLTALGQAEDKTRAQTLGADRYLVKSQVTLEDIVENARTLLSNDSSITSILPTATATTTSDNQTVVAPSQVNGQTADSNIEPPSTAALVAPIPVMSPSANAASEPIQTSTPANSAATATETAASTALAEPLSAETTTTPTNPQSTAKLSPAPTLLEVAVTPQSVPPVKPDITDKKTSTSNTDLLNGAVDELMSNTPKFTKGKESITPIPQSTPLAVPSAPPVTASGPVPAIEPKTVASTTELTGKSAEYVTSGPDHSESVQTLADNVTVAHKKVIKPINDITKKPDLNSLLAAEEAKNSVAGGSAQPTVTTNRDGINTTVVMPTNAAVQTPEQASPVVSPNPSEQVTPANDPSSIAL
jgi:CheY-like chemotaxis protein